MRCRRMMFPASIRLKSNERSGQVVSVRGRWIGLGMGDLAVFQQLHELIRGGEKCAQVLLHHGSAHVLPGVWLPK